MGIGSLFVLVVVGAVAGWIAARVVRGRGQGFLGNMAIGIAGAFLAALILPQIGLSVGGGMIASILHATIGAVILLVLIGLLRKG